MAGWFELSKSSDNQFRFVLKAVNGETILTSELYTSKASAEKGIASVRSNSPQEERYEKKTASNGKFYFNLKAANHQIIGSSQMYATAPGLYRMTHCISMILPTFSSTTDFLK